MVIVMTSVVTYSVMTLGLLVSLQGVVCQERTKEVQRTGHNSDQTVLAEKTTLTSTLDELKKFDLLKDQIDALTSMLKIMDAKLMAAQSKQTKTAKAISKLTGGNSQLINLMSKMTEDNKGMSGKLSKLRADMQSQTSKVNEDNKSMAIKLSRLEGDMQGIKSKLTDDNKDTTSRLSQLTEDNKDMAIKMSKLTEDNKDMASKMSQLTEDNKGMASKMSQLSEDNKDMASKMSKLTEDNKGLASKMSKLSDDNREITAMMSRLSADLTNTTSKLTNDNVNMKGIMLKVSNGQKDTSNFMSKLRDNINVMTQDISDLSKNTNVNISDIATQTSLISKIAENEKAITDLILDHTKNVTNQILIQTNRMIDYSNYTTNEIITQLTNQDMCMANQTTNVTGIEEKPTENKNVKSDDCSGVKSSNSRPIRTLKNGIKVVCDTETDYGGWTVFQRRVSGKVDFFRDWEDYKNGFGELSGSFWLGLENIHRLTSQKLYELRIDLTYKGTKYFATYKRFTVLGEAEGYKLLVSGYSGTASDSLKHNNDRMFSTKDNQQDGRSDSQGCASLYHGGWWYSSDCGYANLNGGWGSTASGKGVNWIRTTTFTSSASFTEMKMRPV